MADPQTIVGNWRVPNQELSFLFMEGKEQGELIGREVFQNVSTELRAFRLFATDHGTFEGKLRILWGCSYKKSVMHKRHEKTCDLGLDATLRQTGPNSAILEFTDLSERLPMAGHKTFTEICESCGDKLPTIDKKLEILRIQ